MIIIKVLKLIVIAIFLSGCIRVVGSPGGGGDGIKVTSPQWYQDRQQKKDRQNMVNALQEEKLQFICVNEEDNHPQLDPQADTWFKQARLLEKATGRPKDYEAIGTLYRKAIERDHYKAMRNLQNLLMDGLVKPLPGKTAPEEAVSIVERMTALNIPAGYYAMGYYLETGYGVAQDKSASIVYFRKSADLGSPEGQYKIGEIFLSKILPGIGENPAYRPDIGKKCWIALPGKIMQNQVMG